MQTVPAEIWQFNVLDMRSARSEIRNCKGSASFVCAEGDVIGGETWGQTGLWHSPYTPTIRREHLCPINAFHSLLYVNVQRETPLVRPYNHTNHAKLMYDEAATDI